MENTSIWAIVIIALVLGLIVGYVAAPDAETVINTVEVEKVVTQINPLNEELQLANVDLQARVDELESQTSEVTIVESNFLNDAVKVFWTAVEDEEDPEGNELDLLSCDGDEYDFDELSESKLSDEWTLTYLDDDEYTVEFETRIKYKESDSRSCRETYDVTVLYEDDEDTIVTVA